MQTSWLRSAFGNYYSEQEQPSFCPKNVTIKSLGTVEKTREQISIFLTSFSEHPLEEVKIYKDTNYSSIVVNRMESEYFQQEAPFHFSFDDTMFLFLWTVDCLRRSQNNQAFDESINEDRVESWRGLLKYAETLCNYFLEDFPNLNCEECTSNVRMVAILISMKFYYCQDEVYNSDFIRAFHLSSTGFEFHILPEIAKMTIEEKQGGITCYQLRKMEMIFITTIFKHTKKERIDDSKQPVDIKANSAQSIGSSSF